MMDDRFKFAQLVVSIPDSTATEIQLPDCSKGHQLRLESLGVDWRVATTSAGAATGMRVDGGGVFKIEGPIAKTSIWVYQASGGAINMHWTYEYSRTR